MKKYFILLTCLVLSTLTYSQDKVFFNDGTVQNGKVIEINKSKVKFITSGTKKKKAYTNKDVNKVVVLEGKKAVEYVYAKVPTQGTVLLAKISKGNEGKASLYVTQRYIYGSDFINVAGQKEHNFGGTVLLYYAKRDVEKDYFDLNYDGAVVNKFKNRASKYLKDCPSLAKRIKNREFGKLDVRKIFEIYDKECQ